MSISIGTGSLALHAQPHHTGTARHCNIAKAAPCLLAVALGHWHGVIGKLLSSKGIIALCTAQSAFILYSQHGAQSRSRSAFALRHRAISVGITHQHAALCTLAYCIHYYGQGMAIIVTLQAAPTACVTITQAPARLQQVLKTHRTPFLPARQCKQWPSPAEECAERQHTEQCVLRSLGVTVAGKDGRWGAFAALRSVVLPTVHHAIIACAALPAYLKCAQQQQVHNHARIQA